MKLVQWPDNFPDMTDATPNLPALRRIGVAFAVALVVCVLMMFVTMAHTPKPAPHKAIPACSCNCMRKGGGL